MRPKRDWVWCSSGQDPDHTPACMSSGRSQRHLPREAHLCGGRSQDSPQDCDTRRSLRPFVHGRRYHRKYAPQIACCRMLSWREPRLCKLFPGVHVVMWADAFPQKQLWSLRFILGCNVQGLGFVGVHEVVQGER